MDDTPVTQEEIDREKWNEEKVEFVSKKRSLNDYDLGLLIPGKLTPKRIKGGIVLEETTYEMREI